MEKKNGKGKEKIYSKHKNIFITYNNNYITILFTGYYYYLG